MLFFLCVCVLAHDRILLKMHGTESRSVIWQKVYRLHTFQHLRLGQWRGYLFCVCLTKTNSFLSHESSNGWRTSITDTSKKGQLMRPCSPWIWHQCIIIGELPQSTDFRHFPYSWQLAWYKRGKICLTQMANIHWGGGGGGRCISNWNHRKEFFVEPAGSNLGQQQANDQDLLRATAVTQGWNRYWSKSRHRQLNLEKKFLLPLLMGLEPETFWSWVWHSNPWTIQRGGTDTEIRVSTDSSTQRRKFSCCSCWDSNPRPFDHESGGLTTELSLLLEYYWYNNDQLLYSNWAESWDNPQ